MKKIMTIIIVVLAVFLIYLGFKDNDIYYLSMGDYLSHGTNPYGARDYNYTDYVKDYLIQKDKLEIFVDGKTDNNKRIIDVMKDINDNIEINVGNKIKTYQNVLIKADLITISIGMNDLLSNVRFNIDFGVNELYNKFEQLLNEYDELFELLRKYCKENIILIGIYNATDNELNEFFNYANNKLMQMSKSYNIEYIDVYELLKNKEYFPNNQFYPNKEAHKNISEQILKIVKEKISKD